ncbi:mangetout [Carabus blaptoides fortunei]
MRRTWQAEGKVENKEITANFTERFGNEEDTSVDKMKEDTFRETFSLTKYRQNVWAKETYDEEMEQRLSGGLVPIRWKRRWTCQIQYYPLQTGLTWQVQMGYVSENI